MLFLYQPTCKLLVHLPYTMPSKALITSSVRWYKLTSQTTVRERLTFEKRIPITFSNNGDFSFLQTPKQSLNCSCHFSVKNEKEMADSEIKKAMDSISEKFMEAMELMNDARSSSGTVYFSEDMEDTQAQVTETLNDYKALLGKLNEHQKKNVIQSIGLKMEELKAQISLLEELAKE